MSQRIAYVIVLLGAMLWGTTGTTQSFMPQTIHPLAIGAIRLAVGGFALLIILLATRKLNFQDWPWKATIFAAMAMAIFQPFFFTAVRMTGIAIGTVVTIGSAPIFSGIIDWVLTKRRPSRVWLMATVLAITGSALLFLNGEGVVVHPAGIAFALGGGFLFAIYTVVNKDVLDRVDTVPAVAVIFSLSAVMLLPLLFLFETEGLWTKNGIVGALAMGIMATSVAYILFSAGLKHIPSSSAVTLSLAEPLTAAILGVVLVGEQLNATSWTGVAMLLGGIVLLTLGGKEEQRPAAEFMSDKDLEKP